MPRHRRLCPGRSRPSNAVILRRPATAQHGTSRVEGSQDDLQDDAWTGRGRAAWYDFSRDITWRLEGVLGVGAWNPLSQAPGSAVREIPSLTLRAGSSTRGAR